MSNRDIWSPASPPEPENDNEAETVLDHETTSTAPIPAPSSTDNIIELRPDDEETLAYAELLEALSDHSDDDTEIEHLDIEQYRNLQKGTRS